MRKAAYIILLLLLACFLTEFSLRLIQPEALQYYWIQKAYHRFDPEYFVDFEPGVSVRVKHFMDYFTMKVSINKMGLRGIEEVDNTLPQIACIGDSITMGFGVDDEDTFCQKLNSYKDSNGIKYQSVNLAVDAYGPSAIALKLKKQLPLLNVKLLYYLPSPGDDIDELDFQKRTQSKKHYNMFKYQFFMTKNSYLLLALKLSQEQLRYRFLTNVLEPILNIKKTLFSWKDYSFFSEFLMKKNISIQELQNTPVELPEGECKNTPTKFPIPDYILQSIDAIIDVTKKHKIKLVMPLTSIGNQTATCSQQGKYHDRYAYLLSLKEELLKRGVDIIDLNEYTHLMLDKEGRRNARPYYIYGDEHYTKLGHEWIYKLLLNKTREVLP